MSTGGAIITFGAFAIALLDWLLALYEKRRVEAYKLRRDAARLPAEWALSGVAPTAKPPS